MRYRYFDPFEQSVIEGELDCEDDVTALVGRIAGLRVDCAPALELAGADGSTFVIGIDHDRAVVLWTGSDGTTRHSTGGSPAGRARFDYFGAWTQVPGHWAVPLQTAIRAAVRFVTQAAGTPAFPALALALD